MSVKPIGESYDERLEAHVRSLGWSDERIRELGHMVTHGPLLSAQDALAVLVLAQEARQEVDERLVEGLCPDTAWDEAMLARRRMTLEVTAVTQQGFEQRTDGVL